MGQEDQEGEEIMGCDSQFDTPKRWESSVEEPTRSALNTPKTFSFPAKSCAPQKTVVFNDEECKLNGKEMRFEDARKYFTNTLDTGEDVGYPGQVMEQKKQTAEFPRPPLTAFEQDLRRLINKYSMENRSNTPDNILAEYLVSCLDVFNRTVAQRETWYGRKVF